MPTNTSVPLALQRVLRAIDPGRMLADTASLCHPTLAGRRVGTEGHAHATNFLFERFSQDGWRTSTQPFQLRTPILETLSPLRLEVVTREGTVERVLSLRTEFCEHPRSASCPEEKQGRAVHLSATTSLESVWIILDAVPQGSAFTELATHLAQQGALGILAPLYPGTGGYLTKRIIAGSSVGLPVLSVHADLLPTLEGRMVRASVPVLSRQEQACNIIAALDGTNQRFAQEPLLIGAHYDGVGDDRGGPRLPGATDNAAAVAVLLELARVLGQHASPPQRSLQLIAFDAEEVGAQGSRALADSYKALGITPQVINVDGAACLHEAIWVEPGPHTEHLLQALDQAGQWLEIPLVLGPIASDHRQFISAGFPALGVSVGAAALHTPDDSMERVQPEALRVAATLLAATIWQLSE